MCVTDQTMGNIYFLTYENSGKAPLNGNFEVELYDDEGNQYPEKKHITDITMEPIQPGATSEARFVEAAVVPKDTKVTSFKVFVGGQPTTYEIPYGTATTATAGATTTSPTTTIPICGILIVLLLLIIGVAVVTERLKR